MNPSKEILEIVLQGLQQSSSGLTLDQVVDHVFSQVAHFLKRGRKVAVLTSAEESILVEVNTPEGWATAAEFIGVRLNGHPAIAFNEGLYTLRRIHRIQAVKVYRAADCTAHNSMFTSKVITEVTEIKQ